MALEPGKLSDLDGVGQADWDATVARMLADAVASARDAAVQAGETELVHLVPADDPDVATAQPVVIDWSANPVRAEICLNSLRNAEALLDWRNGLGDTGRALGHEEYLEWRAVRDASGRIRRLEMTTEVREYWESLAAFHPVKALRVIGRFAGETMADPVEVFGRSDVDRLTPEQRRVAFAAMMFVRGSRPPRSPYNNGLRAITCMAKGVNTIEAAVVLAALPRASSAKPSTAERLPSPDPRRSPPPSKAPSTAATATRPSSASSSRSLGSGARSRSMTRSASTSARSTTVRSCCPTARRRSRREPGRRR